MNKSIFGAAILGGALAAVLLLQPVANAGPWADLFATPDIKRVQVRNASGTSCKANIQFKAKASAEAKAEGAANVVWTEEVKFPCAGLVTLLSQAKSKNDCARPAAWPQTLADAANKDSCQ